MPLYGEAKREYQKKWIANRRVEWFTGKICVDCGTIESLELDHKDPNQKVDHRIWSWSWARIAIETAKCVVRCTPCHKKKSASEHVKGEQHPVALLSEREVLEIREKYANGIRQIDLAIQYDMPRQSIYKIVHKITWKHI